jgi:hypothetical protein
VIIDPQLGVIHNPGDLEIDRSLSVSSGTSLRYLVMVFVTCVLDLVNGFFVCDHAITAGTSWVHRGPGVPIHTKLSEVRLAPRQAHSEVEWYGRCQRKDTALGDIHVRKFPRFSSPRCGVSGTI